MFMHINALNCIGCFGIFIYYTKLNIKFFSYDDPILKGLIQQMNLSPDVVEKLDREIDATIRNPVFGIDDILYVIKAIKLTYEGGKYAARQCEV